MSLTGHDFFVADFVDLLGRQGCPLCGAERLDEDRWVRTFLRDGHRDPDVRRRFLASGGLCRAHTHLVWLACQNDERGISAVAALCRLLVEHDLLTLPRRGTRRAPKRPRGQPCEACAARLRDGERKVYFFCQALADPGLRRSYSRHPDGLCARHTAAVLNEADGPLRAFLLRDWSLRLSNLQRRLAEFDRKRDYRFRGEPRGDEQQAPHDALLHYGGSTWPDRDHAR